jgi:transcriptional regulator with XRE-family HTH domain
MQTNAAHQPASTGPISFRQYLQGEVARRCCRNARYSLRAFARDLGVDHSTLSQILRGRRALSPRAIERHAARTAAGPPSEAEQLTRDAVAILSEGHHHALLELCRLEDFHPDSRWVARVLGLEVDRPEGRRTGGRPGA